VEWDYLNRAVVGTVRFLERQGGFQSDHVYSHALRGFAARLTPQQILQLQNERLVSYIEADAVVRAHQVKPPPSSGTGQVLPWGINRIDADVSSALAGNGSGAVTNVNVYVIDTGVGTHVDLNRVAHVNFVAGSVNTDCNGHGTHVAGTAAARDNATDVVGAVPGAPITGVKVLDCYGSGTISGVIRGIDWVTANRRLPAVANLSLGGSPSRTLDDAVRRSVQAGVFYTVSAGNSGADACTQSPARAGAGTNNGILTVAATDVNNADPYWSNFGSCVDIWAPGVDVLSTQLGGGTMNLSGTSMASPHGAGVAALYRSFHISANPAAVELALKSAARRPGTRSNGGQVISIVNAGLF
jgi:subtilisin family serine protease